MLLKCTSLIIPYLYISSFVRMSYINFDHCFIWDWLFLMISSNWSSKQIVLQAFSHLLNPNMEDLCERIPLLGKLVFTNLDNQSLTNFREVSRRLNESLDKERLLWLRIIKNHKSNSHHNFFLIKTATYIYLFTLH